MREGLVRTGPAEKLTPAQTVSNLYNWRDFIGLLTARELKSRYVGSIGGALWTVIQPLSLIVVFSVVFGAILKMNAVDGSRGYVIYLIVGLLPWNAFQEALQKSSAVFMENANLVKKLPFPLESLVAQTIAVSSVNLLISLALLLIIMPIVGVEFTRNLLLVPAVVLLQILLTLGPAFIVATLSPFKRDVPPITGLALFIGFWLTPVVYIPTLLPIKIQFILKFNPIYQLIRMYRACFMGEAFPSSVAIIGTISTAALFLAIGWLIFAKLNRKIAEVL